MGLETGEIMRAANKDLREQRDVLISVTDKNQNIRQDLDRGNKIVRQMSCREFFYRIALNIVAFLLLVSIVGVLLGKLLH